MLPIKVRFATWFSVAMLAVGALLCLTGILAERYVSLFPGIVLVLVGVLSMINPAYVVEPHEVQVRNMLGMTLKRLPLRGPLDLRVDDKSVWHVPTGRRVMRHFGLDKASIQRVGEFVASGAPGQPGVGQAPFVQQSQAPQQAWNPPQGQPQQPQAWNPPQGQPGQPQAWNPPQGQPDQAQQPQQPGHNPYGQ